MSSAIETIFAKCLGEGNSYDADLHAKEPTAYVMTQPMLDDVRTAGETDAALSYTQTVARNDPQEGFIDEADENNDRVSVPT